MTDAATLGRQRLFDTEQHIPRLGALLGLVAGQVPILIELKTRGGNAKAIARAVADELADYAGPAGVMSFEPRAIKWFARHLPHRRRGLVISERASALDRWNGIRNASPQFLAVDRAAIARPWVAKQRARRWVYSWTIRSPADRQTAEIHADALIWEGDGRPGS
jgi:glycerophosphoryl diester phosphodiesterase